MAHVGDRLEPQPPTELPEVTPPVLLLLCHPRAAGYSPPYNEREPWHAMVAKELERMTKLEIISLLKHYPEFAGYIVAVYGQDRWPENARDLRDATETENWHRDRDLEVRLVHQRDLRWYHFNLLGDIPCDLRRTRRQQFLQLELELAIMKYRDLRQTLQCVQGNQFLYHPWALVPAADLNPLQAQYLAWREYIVQDLMRRLSAARINVLRWTVRLAGHPRPRAALSPILLQGPQVHGVINSANCLGSPRLIDLLVRYDCRDALMMLRRLGVFHPVSFHRRGWTLLHDALIWNAPRVSRWLLNEYIPDHLWRVPYGTPALQHIASPWTDLEFMLYMGWRRWFMQAWEPLRDAARNNLARGADIFQPHTCEILCTFVPTDFAEDLEAAPFNLDIAVTNAAAPNPHVPLAFQNQAGTT
ncbi:hypothetical protein BJY01DRAFT_249747 [Aspergillus pseudoustus]|uniref:Ankyrin repeat-containing domain protein n=1 Tax=Aspergillus pseudoustus TaxID=1810923 RepID=A0ABR4JLY1_9EURO